MTSISFLCIHREHVEATVAFAIEHVPGMDSKTLKRFMEFVNASGDEVGAITKHELLEKMRLLLKYIPSSCTYSLVTLAELLDLSPPFELAFAA